MSLDAKQKELLIQQTRDAALALIEDIDGMREFLRKQEIGRGDVRRWSSVLRRLLIDNDITTVAAPRIGRFQFVTPNNDPIFNAEKKKPYPFFGSGGVEIFGVFFRCTLIERGQQTRNIPEFDPEKMKVVNLVGFLSQPLLCFEGSWITRRMIISYIANKASGVHSKVSRDADDIIIEKLRKVAFYSTKGGMPTLAFNTNVLEGVRADFSYDKDVLDPILVELLATMHFLVKAPDIVKLEALIENEVKELSAISA